VRLWSADHFSCRVEPRQLITPRLFRRVLRGEATYPNATDLSRIPRRSYAFTYSLPFHDPHDIPYCEAEFDIRGLAATFDAEPDAFAAPGQFITVYPDVDKDLQGILANIDATHQDGIDDTAVALKSFSARQDART
jgi:hypothetical protein